MSKLATTRTHNEVNRRVGFRKSHCVVVALSRALEVEAGGGPDDLDALEVWAPTVKEQLQAIEGRDRMTDDGTHRGHMKGTARTVGLPVDRSETYLRRGALAGNPYAKEWGDGAFHLRNEMGTGDRRYDCPTVAKWVRDHPDATALLRVDGHVGFAHRGEAFDLKACQRVDYAVVLEVTP